MGCGVGCGVGGAGGNPERCDELSLPHQIDALSVHALERLKK